MKLFLNFKLILVTAGVVSLLIGLTSCQDAVLITPPTQTLGATLNSQAAEENPNFSYDGRYLVFASDRLNQRSIFLYDLLNRSLIPLPGLNQPGVFCDQPDISADGRYIVYVSQQLGKPDILIYDRQTFDNKNITQNLLAEVRHPTISGNGRLVSFEINRQGQWDIAIYDRGAEAEISLPLGNEE
jgi:Tol biopolymer transport system component